MTVVYIDCVFLLNFIIDYLLLLAAGRLAGEILRRPRIALGAALGGFYAAAVFLPHMEFLVSPLCKIAVAVLMVLTAYGGSRRLLRISLVFFGVSAAFGGGILAIELVGGREVGLQNGVLYSAMDLRLVLLSATFCYVAITFVFQRAAKHSAVRMETAPAVLTLGTRRVALTALIDTGNTLTDPVTGRPVMVAEGEKLTALFPPGQAPTGDVLKRPIEAMGDIESIWKGRCRLLPYQAVGIECGMLLALRMDQVKVGKDDYGGILVALSPTRLSDGGGYSALIGA